MKQKAPIDNKNVTTDWIESIFDEGNCTCGGYNAEFYTGFIQGCAVVAQINNNELRWQISAAFWSSWKIEEVYRVLMMRLKKCDEDQDENSSIYCEYYEVLRKDGYLVQQFYFKDDD